MNKSKKQKDVRVGGLLRLTSLILGNSGNLLSLVISGPKQSTVTKVKRTVKKVYKKIKANVDEAKATSKKK